jgi:signal transduction histidine kinase
MPSIGDRESSLTRGPLEDDAVQEMGDARGPRIALAMTRAVVVAVYCGFCLIALLYVIASGASSGQVVLAASYLVGLLSLQLLYFGRPGVRLRSPLSYLVLAAQVALAYLPILQFGGSWVGLPSLVGGVLPLMLPPVWAWSLFAAIAGSVGWINAAATHSILNGTYGAVGTIVFSLELYGVNRLAGLIRELHTARSELARSAVAQERLRFARDLHGLLGLRLSAMAPKGELAHRLVIRDPDRAKQELSEILETSRRALADVRSVARGYRDLNLDEAYRAANSVLSAASVDVRMDSKHGELPVRIRSLLAEVLREGVTNVLKHSDAEHCEVTLRQAGDWVHLDILNDGIVDPEAAAAPLASGGISVLAERVAALDGVLTAGLDPDGRFHLRLAVRVSAEEEQRADAELAEPNLPGSTVRWTMAVASAAFVGQYFLAVLRVAAFPGQAAFDLSVVYMTALLGIQLFYYLRPGIRLRSRLSYAILLVQAALVFLPQVQFGMSYVSLPGFLAGSALLVLPPVAGWAAFALIVGGIGIAEVDHGATLLDTAYPMVGAVIIGLVVYGLTWMVRSVAELRTARRSLAAAAVTEERLRFARDLHDLLGLSLSAITLKAELAYRLVTRDPDRAREELTEILAISRLALADVRSVAGGYRELSLPEESRTAENLLTAAEVDVRMDLRYGELPVQVGTVLATVLREGVTNVLRHSKGEFCEISVREGENSITLDIINDGVTEEPENSHSGSGLGNLSARVGMVGGELTAGVCPDGRFRLRAKVPL